MPILPDQTQDNPREDEGVYYHIDSLVSQARQLSAGTLAGLTGFRKYVQVDVVQVDFVEFCEENQNQYRTWQPAWNDFWKLYQTTLEYQKIRDMC